MKTTIKKIQDADKLVGEIIRSKPALKESKFSYAWKRFIEKNYNPRAKEHWEKIECIRVDNAMEDRNTKEIFVDEKNPRGYKFTREGLKKCIAEESKLQEEFEATSVEVEPYICTSLPELTDEDKETLKGLIIK